MGLTLIAPPAGAVVSLAEAKAHCRITHAEHDAQIAANITAATLFAEGFMRRALLTQTWLLTLDYDWPRVIENGCHRYRIRLPRPPLQSVSSISCIERDGTERTLDRASYIASKQDAGEWAIEPAFGAAWPCVCPILGAIRVTFVAGFGADASAVPESIRQALLLLIAHWRENPEASATGGSAVELPFGVEALLSQYRIFT